MLRPEYSVTAQRPEVPETEAEDATESLSPSATERREMPPSRLGELPATERRRREASAVVGVVGD